MSSKRKKIKSVIGYDFEHEYFGEKIGRYVVAILFIITVIVLADWYNGATMYMLLPAGQGFFYLGLSIVATVLILMTAIVPFFLPHFEPTLRPKGFRRTLDKRTLTMMLFITVSILLIVSTSILLISITGVFGGVT